jgi:hypothetical protein
MGGRYDKNLVDRINANWDKELQTVAPHPTCSTVTKDHTGPPQKTFEYEDVHLFHDAHTYLGKDLSSVGRL